MPSLINSKLRELSMHAQQSAARLEIRAEREFAEARSMADKAKYYSEMAEKHRTVAEHIKANAAKERELFNEYEKLLAQTKENVPCQS